MDIAARIQRNWERGLEFAALFVLAPMALAFWLPNDQLIIFLWLWTLIGVVMLFQTRSFRWSGLILPLRMKDVQNAILLFFASLALCVLICALVAPERLFDFPRENPLLWLSVMLLYPIFSALPQELIFRALAFGRYRQLLPRDDDLAVVINAAVFAFAHLVYASWIVFALCFLGGVIFAKAYLKRNFMYAWILHSVAGNAVFTSGLGWYFYSGNL